MFDPKPVQTSTQPASRTCLPFPLPMANHSCNDSCFATAYIYPVADSLILALIRIGVHDWEDPHLPAYTVFVLPHLDNYKVMMSSMGCMPVHDRSLLGTAG